MSVAACRVAAQSLPSPEIPAAYVPPAGMCRVWLRDVPPMQQPAPTDCRAALRAKPVDATVIYGPEPKRTGYTPSDWSRPAARPMRDEDRARVPFRSGGESCTDINRDGVCERRAEWRCLHRSSGHAMRRRSATAAVDAQRGLVDRRAATGGPATVVRNAQCGRTVRDARARIGTGSCSMV